MYVNIIKKFLSNLIGKVKKDVNTANAKASRKTKIYFIVAAVLTFGLTFSIVTYNLGAEERALKKAEAEKEAAMIQQKEDETAAIVEAEKMKQEMLDKSERTKDAIMAEGEYSPVVAITEREPEISTKHSNGFSEWLNKNVLRIHINYEIKYYIFI